MGNFKQIKIKNRTFYFFNEIIYIKSCDSNLLKIEKNHTKTLISITLDT